MWSGASGLDIDGNGSFTTRLSRAPISAAGATFQLATYKGASARLAGLAWSSEDLAAALGAATGEVTRAVDP